MFKVFVMYPNTEGATFDLDYYKTTHMQIVREALTPYGLKETKVLSGVSGGGGNPAPYICVGVLTFDAADGYDKGVKEAGAALRADIPNFTNVTPVRQISEVV